MQNGILAKNQIELIIFLFGLGSLVIEKLN